MKKLFKAIRQKNLEEVKAIIEKKPELVNCVAVPPPKKDNGQSPLQVALKIGAVEIVYYLIENGADVNYMEAEDDDPGLRCPVLHDAVRMVMMSLCYQQFDVSDEGLYVVEELLKRGADFEAWANRGHFPEPSPMESNRARYLDDFAASEDIVQEYTIRGKKYETVIKGDVDRTAHTRAVMQRYCKERELF